MSEMGYAANSCLYLGEQTPYLRVGTRLFDPSGKNASYLFKSLDKKEMKKFLNKNFSKDEIIEMLLDFVENGSEYQYFAA